jgi:nicotinamidase-related amidase
VDTQNLFAPGAPWGAPWVEATLPTIEMLVSAVARRTFFTRFIPPQSLVDAPGTWGRYYASWPQVLREELSPVWLDLLPQLERLARSGHVYDKSIYSPWDQTTLAATLRGRGVNTLVISGAETDICVLATVLGAVDRGFRVVVASDAVCSSADQTHDAVLTLFRSRLGQQIETATAGQILAAWHDRG